MLRSRILFALCLVAAFATSSAQAQPQRFMGVTFYYAPPPVDASRAAPVYQGLAVSTDRGVTWASRGWVTSSVSDAAIMLDADERVIFLATDYGVLRSRDDGMNWKLVTGWDFPTPTSIAVEGSDIWLATARGVYQSSVGGDHWIFRSKSITGINANYISDIVITSREIFIATGDGLFRTSNKGTTWIRSGLEGHAISSVIVHPSNPTTVAAISQSEGVWLSTDGGWNWVQRNEGLRSKNVKCLAFSPYEKDVVFVGTRDVGLFRSSNLGAQWNVTGGGLTNFNITVLSFDPGIPDRMYAGAENGSFVSNTRGTTWQPFSIRLGYVSSIILR